MRIVVNNVGLLLLEKSNDVERRTLSHVVDVALVGDAEDEEGVDPLVRTISGMQTGARAQLWRSLAAERKTHRSRKADGRAVANEVEELLAQVDFIRGEIESVQKRLRKR